MAVQYSPGNEIRFTYAIEPNISMDVDTYFFHPDREQPYKDLHEQRQKLNDGLRERGYFPESKYPADVFIVENAGLDVHKIGSADSIGKKGYREFMGFAEGGKPIVAFRLYNKEQKAIINEWWDLLSPEVRFS